MESRSALSDENSSSEELDRPQVKALKHLSQNYDSIFESHSFHNFYSDATIFVDESREVAVHRCILSARSPFFASLFFSAGDKKKFELRDLVEDFEVGFEALAAVLSYLYSGKVKSLPDGVCVCVDNCCLHLGCRPAVDYMVEVLYVSFTFQVSELVNLYQRRLLNILDEVAADDILAIIVVAKKCDRACEKLLTKCIEIIVKSDVDALMLEKALTPDTVKEIMDLRVAQGLGVRNSFPDIHVKRIHRALDSDDVELVSMLLQEVNTDINNAYVLHYAVAHCFERTVTKLLDLGLADVNHQNLRGYTALHVAATRREPKIIMALITRGASPFYITLDGRKALQISKRLTRSADYYRSTEEGKNSSKDKLCIGILEQAESTGPPLGDASLCCTSTGNDFLDKLLYLENRVSLATVLYPGEAKVARFTAQVDGTREFLLATINSMSFPSNPRIEHEHLMRMTALSRTVELAKLFFPCCSKVIDMIMDAEDLPELACHGNDTSEQHLKKRKRYMEIQETLAEAFIKDTVELEKSTAISPSSSPTAVRAARTRRLTAKN